MDRIVEAIKSFFEPLSTPQKLLFGLLSVFIIAVLTVLFYWAARPDYTLLFGSLNPDKAQEIVTQLKEDGVNYELQQNGTAIMVPRSQVYDLRLQYASQGMATGSDYKGYELFDSNTLGMTDFMQRVNKKRALEGELARTINAIEQIDFSRVHLVLPERSPFEDTNVEASASVIVTMNSGRNLRQSQIDGISSLVAGSVEMLNKDRVTIIDQSGNQISNNEMLGSEVAASNAQMKHRKSVEGYLTTKAQSMLDKVLGAGNSIVRVATKHDFEKLKEESKIIDPDSRIIISEEKRSESFSDTKQEPIEYDEYTPPALRGQTVPTSSNNQESSVRVRNYEVNTTNRSYEKPVGQVSRISASVLVNHKRDVMEGSQGQDSVVYERYTNTELNEIREVVSAAIGLQDDRGDVLTIRQVRFDNTLEDYMTEQETLYEEQRYYNEFLRWALILIAVIASMAILYAIFSRMFPQMTPPFFTRGEVEGHEEEERKSLPRDEQKQRKQVGAGEEGKEDLYETELEKSTDMYRRKLSPEAQRRLKMKSKMYEEIKNFAEFKSDEAASLIRSMMVKETENE